MFRKKSSSKTKRKCVCDMAWYATASGRKWIVRMIFAGPIFALKYAGNRGWYSATRHCFVGLLRAIKQKERERFERELVAREGE